MKDLPCLCDGRADIRCDEQHCDLAGPGSPGNPHQCRVCWLRLKKVRSEQRESEEKNRMPVFTRSAPCLFLGEIVDKLGCACPAKWIRCCTIHKACNLERCKNCPDYEAIE
jgi:hypothetical protein